MGALLVGCTPDPGGDTAPDPTETEFEVPTRVLLSAPVAEGEESENTTVRTLVGLVGAAPAGSRVRIIAHSFSLTPVAEALAEAHRRGVRVQVLTDLSVSGTWRAPGILRDALGTDTAADSFVHLADGSLHQKVWSFTETGGRRDVVLVGSMNLTYVSARQYNDMVPFVGRAGVRRFADDLFEDLVRGLPDPTPRPPRRLGDATFWTYPGPTSEPDPVASLLGEIPAGADTRVRVVMHAWLEQRGLRLAQRLVALHRGGADVEVVLGGSVGPVVRETLAAGGVPTRPGTFSDGSTVHHKLLLVEHPDAGGDRVRFVLTGSDNWTEKSLGRPEILVRLTPDRRTWRDYQDWVDRLVARGDADD